MNKPMKIFGGVTIFIIGAVSLAVLKELRVGGIVYGVAVFLFLMVFSRVTGWNYGRKNTSQNDVKENHAEHAASDLQSEKICPKCKKGYDRSWGICLNCQVQLVANNK